MKHQGEVKAKLLAWAKVAYWEKHCSRRKKQLRRRKIYKAEQSKEEEEEEEEEEERKKRSTVSMAFGNFMIIGFCYMSMLASRYPQ